MKNHEELRGGFRTHENEIESATTVPSSEELVQAWQKYHDKDTVFELSNGMFGVYELPDKQPSAIISLDLCEVLRETGPSLTRMYGHSDTDFLHHYGEYYGDAVLGEDAQVKRSYLLPLLMQYDHVQPVPFSDSIAAFMRRWRANGVYIIANTSTLPGCEIDTVRFLSKHYSQTMQGILLPRNHDGNGTTTKAGILQYTAEQISARTNYDMQNIPAVAIEDAHHHAIGYVESPADVQVIMPAYSWNEPLEGIEDITRVEQQLGTLDSFIAADNYLVERGIL
ncbi:MAG TPA: hypothetical protein VGE13_03780 [Candidatus Saccharimonadales bacterium]